MSFFKPRFGWEKFECFNTGDLIDPSDSKAMSEAIVYRWAFVIGWGNQVWWAIVKPTETMERF